MKLQGQSTLTEAEKITEARVHVEALKPHRGKMAPNEAGFVTKMADRIADFGERAYISNQQLFFMRDLRVKY